MLTHPPSYTVRYYVCLQGILAIILCLLHIFYEISIITQGGYNFSFDSAHVHEHDSRMMFILNQRCRVEYQLPNLIVGAITKESLYNAFENGITGEQASIKQQHSPSILFGILFPTLDVLFYGD